MGLANSPGYFQATFTCVMTGLVGVCCEIYIDDIIVYSSSQEELIENLSKVLQRLQDHDIRVKLSKCQFGLQEVHYLGFVVGERGIKISPKRKEALRAIARPTTPSELRSFLGMVNFIRPYIPSFATVAKELYVLSTTESTILWSEENAAAFESIKRSIADATLLHH